ncbi:MAG: S-methyl-5'-thioinosine phosphorylase [bacterium JZ-2024 1]
MRYGVIGGSGFYKWPALEEVREETIRTPWGEVRLVFGRLAGKEILFIPRHGARHTIPPHLVNYRAHLAALKEAGAERVLATSAVGSMNPRMEPGDFILLSDFIDFTKGRPSTFAGENRVLHIDMTCPYCPQLREVAQHAGASLGLSLHSSGVYVCTEGARFETPAEIRAFRCLGGDLVGMTGVPEVVLARELGLCYLSIAVVTNWAAGLSDAVLMPQDVSNVFSSRIEPLRTLMKEIIRICPPERQCGCAAAPGRALAG